MLWLREKKSCMHTHTHDAPHTAKMLTTLATLAPCGMRQGNSAPVAPPTDNLQLWFKFDALVNTNKMTNYGLRGGQGTMTGTALSRYATGTMTAADGSTVSVGTFTCDATNYCYLLDPTITLTNPGSWSWLMWVKPNRATGTGYISYWCTNATANQYNGAVILEVQNGTFAFTIPNANKYLQFTDPTWHAMTSNTWRHIACTLTVNSGVSVAKMYINGNLQMSGTHTAGSQPANLTTPARNSWIGSGSWSPSQLFYAGQMRGARLYSRELTQSEIQACMNAD